MDTIKINKKQTKMIAHRGVSKLECENTVPAFVAAGNRSYYGIETDVHVTKDGKLILHHDDTAYRLTGVGDVYMEQTNFDELRSIPLISPVPGDEARKDLFMPSLEEYISVCKKYEKIAVLELKNPMPKDALQKICDTISGMEYLNGTIFISFSYENLVEIRKMLPNQRMQFLTSKYTDDLIDKLKAHNLELDIAHSELNKKRIDALHEAGIKINCWTVDDSARAEELADMGVDYITSNILE